MKKITIIGLIFILVGLSVGIYHLVETRPSEKYFMKKFTSRLSLKMTMRDKLTRKILREYEEASDIQGIVIGISGIIALLLGIIAITKEKNIMNIILIILSIAVLLIPLSTKTHLFS